MGKSKKTSQLNIRVTPGTLVVLDEIARLEDRGRSELARFFVEWATDRYGVFGSLRAMRMAPIEALAKSEAPSEQPDAHTVAEDQVKKQPLPKRKTA